MGEIEDTARRLLREMGQQAEGSPTPDVLPKVAAENLDLDPGAPEYEAALNHLLALGDIEPRSDPALVGEGRYRLTRRGSVEPENYAGGGSLEPRLCRRPQSIEEMGDQEAR